MLQRVREHLSDNYAQWRALVESPSFRRVFGNIEGESLSRVPRGFPRDHPAARYLKLRQFLAGREYASAFSTSPRFYPTVVRSFELLGPVIRFLNEPLLAAPRPIDPLSTDLREVNQRQIHADPRRFAAGYTGEHAR